MKKNIIKIIVITTIFLPEIAIFAENGQKTKESELLELRSVVQNSTRRVEASGTYRGRDLLKLLPTISVARREPYGETPSSETYISASINITNLFDITDTEGRSGAISPHYRK